MFIHLTDGEEIEQSWKIPEIEWLEIEEKQLYVLKETFFQSLKILLDFKDVVILKRKAKDKNKIVDLLFKNGIQAKSISFFEEDLDQYDEDSNYDIRIPMILLSYEDLFQKKEHRAKLKFFVETLTFLPQMLTNKQELQTLLRSKRIETLIIFQKNSSPPNEEL